METTLKSTVSQQTVTLSTLSRGNNKFHVRLATSVAGEEINVVLDAQELCIAAKGMVEAIKALQSA